MTSRFVLLDATKASDQVIDKIIQTYSDISIFLKEGCESDDKVDTAKLDALKAALDVGAITEELHQQAMKELIPSDPFAEDAKRLELLKTALAEGALSPDTFRDAVSCLHLALDLNIGDRVLVTDNKNSDWLPASVTRISADSGHLQVYAKPDIYDTDHVWKHLKKPEDEDEALTPAGTLQKELEASRKECEQLRLQLDALTKQTGTGDSRLITTRVTSSQAKYELYGFAFDISASTTLRISAVHIGTRASQPCRVTIYHCVNGFQKMRQDPDGWKAVSDPVVMDKNSGSELVRIELSEPVSLQAGDVSGILIHTPDDIQGVVYHRSDHQTETNDGCIQVLPGTAVQANRLIPSSSKGFSFVGTIEYVIVGATETDKEPPQEEK
eukprot:TRINITY_DN2455_c0_g1_i4.p2 TRINITY_DN2455_c0_g1~~TRINITY_DN2455_c0_g1_i4.p2  ORF type:complete len:384 (+),score=70.61 TRINITY_DN2455_c0_g1_i4:226-1377(+)